MRNSQNMKYPVTSHLDIVLCKTVPRAVWDTVFAVAA